MSDSKHRDLLHGPAKKAGVLLLSAVLGASVVPPAAIPASDGAQSAAQTASASSQTSQQNQSGQYLVLGQDLTDAEKQTVLSLLGVTDLATCTVSYVTNQEEHDQLGKYVPETTIGSHALSSALITPGAAGSGIQVETKHITYCTPDMYKNALETAGVKDVHVIVAGPYDISGTAALVGITKLYQEATGETLDLTSMDAANAELAVTSQLGQEIGTEQAANLVTEMKTRMTGLGSNYSRDQISASLDEYAGANSLNLSDQQKKSVLDLMDKLAEAEKAAEESRAASQAAAQESAAQTTASSVSEEPVSTSETAAGAMDAQKGTLADADVLQIRIGYEFDDGSMDEWARGTGTLVNGQYVMTSEALSDLSTDSSLYADILEERGDQYDRIGVSLSDQDTTEKHIKVVVTDINGKTLNVSDTFHQNGMGCLILATAVQTSPAVFADTDQLDYAAGTPVSLKYAGQKDKTCDVRSAQGVIGGKASGSGSGGFQITADTDDGNPNGAPVFDANGNLIGMAAGKDKNGGTLLCYTAASMQAFLTSNGVKYQTLSQEQGAKDQTQAARNAEDVDSAAEAVVDLAELKSAVSEADAVERSQYTDSSLSALDAAASAAADVLSDSAAAQSEVDQAASNVRSSVQNLQKVSSAPIVLTILTALLASVSKKPLLIGGLILILVLMMIIRKAGRKQKKDPNETIPKPEDEEEGFSGELSEEDRDMDITRQDAESAASRPVPPSQSNLPYRDETTNDPQILTRQPEQDPEGTEETSLLSNGYLVRTSNGEQIALPDRIDPERPFLIGKEVGKVNYVISGDQTVSRQHAAITRTADRHYYIEDRKSKNGTYLNDERVQPYRKIRLEDGEKIRLSDVEFIFHERQ